LVTTLSLADIARLITQRLCDAGAGENQARSVTRSVVRAEADGIGLVGLGDLATYLSHWCTGPVDGHAIPILSQPRPAALLCRRLATGAKAEGSASKSRKHISTSCTEISP
jgi:LDH2 family malate/lactate/ureidoglycolate dehydrogenase